MEAKVCKFILKHRVLVPTETKCCCFDLILGLLLCNRSMVTLALTVLTSSQAILIVWSKRAGKYEYSVTTANFSVRTELVAFYITVQKLCSVNF